MKLFEMIPKDMRDSGGEVPYLMDLGLIQLRPYDPDEVGPGSIVGGASLSMVDDAERPIPQKGSRMVQYQVAVWGKILGNGFNAIRA